MSTLIQNLDQALETVENLFERNRFKRLLEDLQDIETEILGVSQARALRRDLRTFIHRGGAALIVDRGKLPTADPQETTVMVSLETLKRLLLKVAELTADLDQQRHPTSELLVGLEPVPESAIGFTIDDRRSHSLEGRELRTGVKL